MTDLQALISGALLGALWDATNKGFLITVEQHYDADGNYLPMITVTGRETGDKVLVRVDTLDGQ